MNLMLGVLPLTPYERSYTGNMASPCVLARRSDFSSPCAFSYAASGNHTEHDSI